MRVRKINRMKNSFLPIIILIAGFGLSTLPASTDIVGASIPFNLADKPALDAELLDDAFRQAVEVDNKLQEFLNEREAPYRQSAGGRYGGRSTEELTLISSVSRNVQGLDVTNSIKKTVALYVIFNVGHRLGADQVGGFFIVFDITASTARHYKDSKDEVGTLVNSKANAVIVEVTKLLDVSSYERKQKSKGGESQ